MKVNVYYTTKEQPGPHVRELTIAESMSGLIGRSESELAGSPQVAMITLAIEYLTRIERGTQYETVFIHGIEKAEEPEKDWVSSAERGPQKPGRYLVTLDAPENRSRSTVNPKFTGRMVRWMDEREYVGPGVYPDWVMDGEDVYDYHWSEQGGSSSYERVVAWMGPIDINAEIYQEELADGYEYVWEL